MENRIVGIASDHAGFELKQKLIAWMKTEGIACKDFGAYSEESSDYPDFGHPLALAVENNECYPGIAICGTGNGINIVLNKHPDIRAVLCWTSEIARLCRAHNDANVLSLPGRFVSTEEAIEIVIAFLNTPFEGGRHIRRIEKIRIK